MAGTVKTIPEWVHGSGAKASSFILVRVTLVGGTQTATIPVGYEPVGLARTNAGGVLGHLEADTGGGSNTLTVTSDNGGDTSDVTVLLAPLQP